MLTINFAPFPILFTEHLVLREISTTDAAAVFAFRSSKEAMRYIDRPIAGSIDDAVMYIQKLIDNVQNNEGITWGIALRDGPDVIGTIGFWQIDKSNHRAEIGYMLHPSHQRKGYMQEAILAVLEYGFTTMQLHSVEAHINPANEASKKILDKNKFVQEALFRENYYYNGQFLDSHIYSLLTPFR